MKIQKYICSNILSLLGNISLVLILYFIISGLQIFPKILYMKVWTFINSYFYCVLIIILFSFLMLIEIIINKKYPNKIFTNFEITNKIQKIIYNLFFYTGFVFSLANAVLVCLYLSLIFASYLLN